MADKRKRQRRRENDEEKPTKEEYEVAKFLRFNLPAREGKLVGMSVQYFIASKAVEALMSSKWGGDKGRQGVLFPNRSSCIEYCNRLLEKGIFHRAAKVEKRKDKKKKKKESDKEEEEIEEEKEKKKDKKSKKKEADKKEKDKKESEKEKDKKSEKESEAEKKKKDKNSTEDEKRVNSVTVLIKDDEKKKKKKMKLEMHDYQLFEDGDNIYVWIYDPVPMKTFVIGLFLVLGAGAVCLFPLWPPEVRLGVYYLSLAAACFVGFILVLCVVRVILFCLIWVCTFGKHHFWLLPNLTEDVGFFDSFKPLYHHEYMEKSMDDESKDKDSSSKSSKKNLDEKGGGGDAEEESGEDEEAGDNSQRESNSDAEDAAADNDNGYEMIDHDEVANQQQETKKDK